MAALAAILLLVLVAPVASAGGMKTRAFGPACYTAPPQRDALVEYARYVLDNYDVVAPEDVGSSRLTQEIAKQNYFGTLDCFVSRLDNAIRKEVRWNQPTEDADAAIAWFHALVELRT